MAENSAAAWPSVGQSSVAVAAHANNLKKEIQELQKYSERSGEEGDAATAKAVPYHVFKDFSNSVLLLLDKVIEQPNLKDLAEAIERIDNCTKMILTNVQSSKEPIRSSIASPAPVPAATPAQTAPDPVVAREEDIPGLPPFPPETLERLKTLPPQTVERIIEGKRKEAAAVLATRGQVRAGRGETSKATPFNVTAISQPGGGSSKLVLETQTAEQGKELEKIYSSLDKAKREIRLVKLSPDIDPEYDVCCEMSAVSLNTRPVYQALSYTWGNQNDTVPITLNGQRLAITRNLKKALQRLRTINTKTPVWIDALSINQFDPAERTHQVEMMRVIFQNPKEVIVWLGDDTQPIPGDEHWDASCFDWGGDEADISSINSVLAFAAAYGDTYPEKPDARSANPLMLGFCLMRLLAGDVHLADIPLLRSMKLREQCMKAFSSLVAQPWWNRIWVIQEVTLPSKVTVVFGRFTAPLRMYALASSNLERHKSSCCVGVLPPGDRNSLPMEDFCRKMLAIVESGNLWRRKESITLLTLLRLYYSKDATDARDKVYGLLGLVTDWGNSRAIAPNYKMRTSELYQEVALRSMEVSGSLAILTFRTERNYQKMMGDLQKIKEGATYYKVLPLTASASEKYMQDALRKKHKSIPDAVELDMPSWTPDWETINKRGYEVGTSERINRAFIFDACASRPSPPSPTRYTSSSILTRTRVLTLSALRIGTVDHDNFKYFMPFLVNRASAIKIDHFPLPSNPDDLDQPYVAGGTEYDAVWRTVCGDAFFVGSHSSAGLDGHTMFRRTTLHDKTAVQAWRRWLGRQKTMRGSHRAPAINDFSSPEEHAMATEADRTIRSVGLQRRYFNTDTGYMGMGSSAQAGDEVFVLLGSRTPYLLRSMGDIDVEGLGATRLYTLIGEAYVQGVMDGELVKKSEVEIQELLVI